MLTAALARLLAGFTLAAAGSPGLPASSIGPAHDGAARYCVRDYAPNRAVMIHNESSGASATIHANFQGAGCADVAVVTSCGSRSAQTVVATGVGADGNPATSSASLPESPPGCAGSGGAGSSAASDGGSGHLSAATLVLLGVAGAALVGLAAIAIVAARRRRSASAA